VQTGQGPPCVVSFRENHWPGLADHRTVAALLYAAMPSRPCYLHHSTGRHSGKSGDAVVRSPADPNCCHSLLRDLDRPSYLTKARTKAIGCSTGINLGITSQAPCYPALPGGGVKPTVDVDWSRAWPPGVLPPVPRNDGAPRWGYEGLHRATTAALERRLRLSCGPAGTGLLGLLSWADGPRLADRCSRHYRPQRCESGR
jgi:hypothetical protein